MSKKSIKAPSPPAPTIAIVEDDRDLSDCWAKLLSIRGYRHFIYQNATEALNDMENIKSSDIFITDYYLPDLNGIELGRKLREKLEVPFILLTGSKEESVVKNASEIENLHILYKPLRFKTLEEKIKTLLNSPQ